MSATIETKPGLVARPTNGFGRFFREATWMTLATIVGGASFALVHRIAPHLAPGEYSVFATIMQIVNGVSLAAVGFQVVIAKIVAESLTDGTRRDAASAARRVLLLALGAWGVLGIILVPCGGALRSWIGAQGAWPWVWLLGVCLCVLFQLVFLGVLQGLQDFRWFGVVSVLAGVGRLVLVWAFVVGCGWGVTGAVAGMFAAGFISAAVAAWRSWPALTPRGGWASWRLLSKRSVILITGVGTLALLFSMDQLMSRRFLPAGELDNYAAAGTIGRVVVLVTVPLTNVMFPKVARSIAEETRPAAFFDALGLVTLVGVAAAVVCTLLPSLPIRLLQGRSFMDAATLVPLFAWAVLPLTLATVLVNNLLARGRFGVVLPFVLLTAAYWFFLESHHGSARVIILGIFTFASAACLLAGIGCWLAHRSTQAAVSRPSNA